MVLAVVHVDDVFQLVRRRRSIRWTHRTPASDAPRSMPSGTSDVVWQPDGSGAAQPAGGREPVPVERASASSDLDAGHVIRRW